MPKRNAIKEYGEDEYYQVYNRGVAKMEIFRDIADYEYMLSLFKKYLSSKTEYDKQGRLIPNYREDVDLVAYCLMGNHFHMLIYLKDVDGLHSFMRSVLTSYSMYFNRKYRRVGGLFESRFLASRVTNEAYLWHVSRYIHLNPLDIGKSHATYPFSSVRYFAGEAVAEWIHPEVLVETAAERSAYMRSLRDNIDYHKLYHRLRSELANA